MLHYDIEHLWYWLFSRTMAVRVLVLALELSVCAGLGMALAKRCARHPVRRRLAILTVWAVACTCMVLFPLRLREDYAYTVLGGELFGDIPDAMCWLAEHGRKSRLVRTVRAPSREGEGAAVWNNTRFFAALVLNKKDPGCGRELLPSVPPFEGMIIDWETVSGTNWVSVPGSWPWFRGGTRDDGWPLCWGSVSGADILQWGWDEGTNGLAGKRNPTETLSAGSGPIP